MSKVGSNSIKPPNEVICEVIDGEEICQGKTFDSVSSEVSSFSFSSTID